MAPVDRWLAPLSRFLHIEAASGIVLLACTGVALALANSPLAGWFAGVWKTPVSLSLGGLAVSGDIGHLIVNDGLMTVFFFVVGLELKRELVHGELREPWLLTPAYPWIGPRSFADVLLASWQRATGTGPESQADAAVAGQARFAAHESMSPLQRLEHDLHPWVAFGVMPVFALANAGVSLSFERLGEPVAVAIAVALAVGKPAGILLLCAVAVRLRVTDLPAEVTWGMLAGGACLAGIGFTMALFLNTLAFPVDQYAAMESAGKIGILAGSVASAVIGAAVMARALASARSIGPA